MPDRRARMASMSSIYDRLTDLDISLPPLAIPAGAYVPFVRSGNLELGGCLVNVAHVVQVRGADFWVYPEVGTGTVIWMIPTQPAVALAALGGRVRVLIG